MKIVLGRVEQSVVLEVRRRRRDGEEEEETDE